MKIGSLNKGLVLHMPLDQESLQSATVFADKTPYENAGTSVNTPVFVADRMGQIRAMQFNGSTDYVNCGNSVLNNLPVGSVSIWIKPTNLSIFFHYVMGSNTPSGGCLALRITTNGGGWWGVDSSLIAKSLPADTFEINNWYHVIIIWDGTNWKLYKNRILIDTISNANGTSSAGNPILIGEGWDGYTFHGSIADVRIYNRAITTAERTALYEMYRPKLSLGSL